MSSEEMTKEEIKAEAATFVRDMVFKKKKKLPKPVGLETYKPRETDIIITGLPKSGTTLTQQLTYQVVIATGGACDKDPDGMSFNDINSVVPLVDFGAKHGFPDFESNPRCFKTHATSWHFKSDIQKHLVVVRNPETVPASMLDYTFDVWAGECNNKLVREEIFHQFLGDRILGSGGYQKEGYGFPFDDGKPQEGKKDEDADKLPLGPWFIYNKSWFEKMRSNMLFIFYEDIIGDMSGTAKLIAAFMGRELDEDGLQQVLARCDRNYMSSDKKFQCNLSLDFYKNLDYGENQWKAKTEKREGFKQFKPTEEEKKQINLRFEQEFGVESYEEFRKMVAAKQTELGVKF